VEQSFETMWRMAKVAGAVDTTVRIIETVIEVLPTFRFRNTAGREMPIRDLAGLARSVQAATSVPQGASFDELDVKFIEGKVLAVQAEMIVMLGQTGEGRDSGRITATTRDTLKVETRGAALMEERRPPSAYQLTVRFFSRAI
jgi:hypothetical protein